MPCVRENTPYSSGLDFVRDGAIHPCHCSNCCSRDQEKVAFAAAADNLPSFSSSGGGAGQGESSYEPLPPAIRENTLPSEFRYSLGEEKYYHYGYMRHKDNFLGGMKGSSYASPDLASSGLEAESIFALPAQASTRDAVYEVLPNRWDIIVGPRSVQPAYNQPGGGKEVFFPVGTGFGTVSDPEPS